MINKEKIIGLSRGYLEGRSQPIVRSIMDNKLAKHRCSILLGARGVGKTTVLIQQLLRHANQDPLSSNVLYIPCDHFLIEGCSLYEITEQFQQLGAKVIAFDEIHKYSSWSKELKSIYDTFPDLTILASGSSALEIHKGSHDLSRRAIIHQMPGLSFREYLELTYNFSFDAYSLINLLNKHEQIAHNILNLMKQQDHKILELFNRYLNTGFFPYFLEIKDKELYWLTLEQSVVMTIESDLVAVYPKLTGSTVKKLKLLLSYIAQSVPFTINWSKIKKIVDVADDRTLKTYFKYLEDAGLIRSVSKFSSKLAKLESPEKIFLNNPNQIQALSAGLGDKGNMRETFFLCMLGLNYQVSLPAQGDFMIDGKYCFEVGGSKKSLKQVKHAQNPYVAADNLEVGFDKKIPLWLFGFLY